MTGIYAFGLVLIAISAILLAIHWNDRREYLANPPSDDAERTFRVRQFRRRTQANALIGLVGLAMTLANRIPKNATALSLYLFGLIIAALTILWLAISDLVALRLRRIRLDRDRLASSLREHAQKLTAGQRGPLEP